MAGIQDAYERFFRVWGNSEPIRRPDELAAALTAAGKDPAQANEDWLRSLDRDWVYGDSDAPFKDERTNREYRRLVAQQ